MWSTDSNVWEVPCDISRVAEIRPSDISGALLDRSWFNDVLGTYMQYEVTMVYPPDADGQALYNTIYELLTQPVAGHTFVFPYNSGTIEITGRVQQVSDVYVQLADGLAYWKGIRFTVLANHPSKSQTLEEAIAYGGASVLPESQTIAENDMYEYTSEGWEPVSFDDGDTKRY
jgi:hypothetical protein